MMDKVNILIADDELLAITMLKEALEELRPDCNICTAQNYIEVENIIEGVRIDIAFLDIEMPGKNGINIAKGLIEHFPKINIIFVTAYKQYALDAFDILASGYLLKPWNTESLESQLCNLRYPIAFRKERVRMQCFGNFEAFVDEKPIAFSRSKSKELLALLVDRRGAAMTIGEITCILFEDDEDEEKNKIKTKAAIGALRTSLNEAGVSYLLRHTHNAYSIVQSHMVCDYYDVLKNNPDSISSYQGNYMTQYSWSEYSIQRREV